MGNSNSVPNNTLNSHQQYALTKLETILGGSDTETFVTNQNNEHLINRFNNLMNDSEVNNKYNAVTGDTETLNHFIQPESSLNHAVFETTSDALPFTISENLVPVVKPSYFMTGGNNSMETLNKLSNLLQDSESNFTTNAGNANIVNKLSSLLESTETNDYAINFRGGGLDSENLFTSEEVKGGKHEESEKSEKHGKHGKHEEKKEETEEKKEETEEEKKESEQSGGVELDSELKNILMTLKKENAGKNVISGGKTKKGGKKSKKSNRSEKSKSSRRSATSAVESDNSDEETSADNTDESESEEYLTSTSSLNTSDINVKHYR
jgi:hypothetical protein